MHINQLMYYNCYEIMYINKYRLWDRTQKITWFHILLARNNLSFFAVTRSPAHLTNRQWSCLAVQALASNLRLAIFWKTAITDTISSSSFVVDVDGCCVTITYFPDHVVLNPRTCVVSSPRPFVSQGAYRLEIISARSKRRFWSGRL